MRIIGGEHRSRRLHTPKDDSVTRPIPDRVKESLFGILRGNCEGASVFDGFAGTGSIGLEAISRGAARCVFVERDKSIARILERNIAELGAADRCELVCGDALGPGALARCPRPVDLVFLDPPYPLVLEPAGWQRVRTQFARLIDLLSDGGFAILRTPWPFSHEVQGAPQSTPDAPSAPRTPRAKRHGREGRRRDAGDARDSDFVEVTLADADGRDLEEVLAERLGSTNQPAPVAVQRVRVDLALPNAEGPETHTYQSMAIHFYMRKRAAAG